MKRVLVPLTTINYALPDGGSVPLQATRETYINKLFRYNLVPIFVPVNSSQEVVDELYGMCSGVLCMGGPDLDPALYNEEKHPETDVREPERDRLEISIIKRALQDKKPFLGICRGEQALAIASGGSLYQHIPDIAPEEDHGNGKHFKVGDDGKRSNITILPSTRLYKMVGKDTVQGTCNHHQAVKEPGSNMVISARSLAGIVEAIEHSDPTYFCFGVEGHPETEENGDFEVLFAELAKAC